MDNIKLLSCAAAGTGLFNCIIDHFIYAVPHHFDGFQLDYDLNYADDTARTDI